jgi:hypothetical protein
MEMKSYKIIELYRALEKLMKNDVELRTAVALARNFEAVSTPAKIIDQKQQDLMKEYAKKDENGEVIQGENGSVTIESPTEYFAKLQNILETDIDVELKPIKIDALKGIKISGSDILALDPVLEDEDDKKEKATED